jgi:transposase-like protein
MARPDFPLNLLDFQRRFRTEEDCFRYFVDSRWPDGFACPSCGGGRAFARGDRLALQCASCKRFYTATAGTVMHGSRQPLGSWLLAAFLLVVDKRGVSAVQLQRVLGIKRHEVAYQMLHKLRAAMVAPDRTPLRGLVEVDETFVGGERRGGGSGRWKGAQEVVVGAVEVYGVRTPGRLRLKQIPDDLQTHILGFVRGNVEEGSVVRTDGSPAYPALTKEGYRHEVESTAHGMKQAEVLQTLHLAFSNLKTWLHGTFHGAVRKEHLQAYLNEFVFRFNRRGNLHAAFQRVLGIGTTVAGPTYAGIYDGTWAHPNPDSRRRKVR